MVVIVLQFYIYQILVVSEALVQQQLKYHNQKQLTDADTEANRLLKIKKKGRSQSIMTGSKGVTKTSTDYSLGKKSLLGRV
jgi:hypothetical protein